AAQHPAFSGVPGSAQSRLEALHVGLIQRAAFPVAGRGEDLLAGCQIEVGLTVILLDERLRVRPSYSEVERQRGRDLVVVLEIQRQAVVQLRPRRRGAAAPFRRHLIEQEIGEWEARKCATVGEQTEQSIVSGVEALLYVVQQLSSDLEGLTAFDPGDLV